MQGGLAHLRGCAVARRARSPARVCGCAPRRGSPELEGVEVAAALEEAVVARRYWNALGDVQRCFPVCGDGECDVGRNFGWLVRVGEDDNAKDARRLRRLVGVYVGIRGCSGIAQKVFFGSGSLWKQRNWPTEVCGSETMGSSSVCVHPLLGCGKERGFCLVKVPKGCRW